MFILVRHAHAEDSRLWTLPDLERPLSPYGWQQAEGLAENLAGLQNPRLVASSYLRSHQTLTPLANRSGQAIETNDVFRHPASPVALDQVLADPALEGAVVCLHGETVTALIRYWHRHHSVQLLPKPATAPEGPTEEGAAWIVVEDETGRSAHYLRPLHLGPVLGLAGPAEDHRARRSAARHLVGNLRRHRHTSI